MNDFEQQARALAASGSQGYRIQQGHDGLWYAVFKSEQALMNFLFAHETDYFAGCELCCFGGAYNAYLLGTMH